MSGFRNHVHPHKNDYIMYTEVKDTHIHVVVDKTDVNKRTEYSKVVIASFYIGEHMIEDPKFSGENHKNLRKMIGDFFLKAYRDGSVAGYRMAQSDIRQALGI